MDNRRKLVLGLGAGALVAPLRSFAQQQGKVWHVGFLYLGSRQSAMDTGRYSEFVQGMSEIGYVEGKNLVIEPRFADGNSELVSGFATQLVQLKLDAIVATGTSAYRALQKSTSSIPIVITVSADPVGEGFAASLARPGGNLTGLSSGNADIYPKHIELLKAAVPRLARIAVLVNPANTGHVSRLRILEIAAQKAGVTIIAAEGRTSDEIERSLSTMPRERAKALIVLGDTLFLQQVQQIAQLALKYRLPSTYITHEYAEAGGMMSYGQNVTENFRRAATYVDKIFKGAKPGSIPIEQPTRYEMVINIRTANALGIKFPQTIMVQATKVIE